MHKGEESYSKMNDADEASEDEPQAGDLESINIRIAEGGFVASCSRRPKQVGDGMPPWMPSKDYVFESKAALLKWVKAELGD